jgi:predicted RNase H-like nuclease (RuvC/YqgF family)
MPEEKKRPGHKLSAWISDSLYDGLLALGYFGRQISQTDTIIKALEMLLKESNSGDNGRQKDIEWEIVGDLNDHTGDHGGLGEIEAQVGDLQELIMEKDRHIETLKSEIDKAGKDKEAIQNLYNNYMLQMQTLINRKAIEATGAKKHWWQFW